MRAPAFVSARFYKDVGLSFVYDFLIYSQIEWNF